MLLILDAESSTYKRSTADFTTVVDLELNPETSYEIALCRFDSWYSINNVIAGYNNTLRYSPDAGATWFDITIPPGIYSVPELNQFLHSQMYANGHYTTPVIAPEYDINIVPNYSTSKASIWLSNGYQIDVSPAGSMFRALLGFDSTQLILTANGENVPNNRADISNGVNNWLINVSCVGDSFLGGIAGNVIYSFAPSEPPQSGITLAPTEKSWLPLKTNGHGLIREIRCWLTDQRLRPLDLSGEPMTLQLEIRPARIA